MLDNQSLRILFLADAEAAHTRRWVNWFAKRNYEVHLVSFNSKLDFGYDPNVNIHVISSKLFNHKFLRIVKGIYIIIKLSRLVNKIKPDVTHCHSVTAYSWLPTLLGITPLVITPWGTEILVDIKVSKLNYLISRHALRSADLVTTDAKHFLPELSKLGVRNALYLPFGTDTNIFAPTQGRIVTPVKTFISTRTLNPVHDVGLLIKVIPEILKEHPLTRFIIVGGGSQYSEFKDYIEIKGCSNNVEFTGMLSESELLEKLQKSDVYISTSPLDAGLAASTAEAMSTGLPVVVNDTADNRIWVNIEGGLLFTNHSLESLTSNILLMINMETEKLFNMGKRNRELIVESNSLDKSMGMMLSEYRAYSRKLTS